MRIRFVSTALALLGFLAVAGAADAQSGTIAGKVTQSEGGAAVVAAQISVNSGMTRVAASQSGEDGSYRIANVPAGTYTVVVTRIGFAARRTDGVQVSAGGTTTVNVLLAELAAQLNQVVTTATRGAEWRSVLAIGAPNMLGWHTMSILGVKELASGRAAILGFTMPIWTVLISVLFLGEKLTRRVAVAAVAVAIAIALLTSSEFTALSGRPLGIVWMEIAAVCWAVGTLLMRRATLTLPVETLTIWTMILASACLWLIALASEPWPSWQFTGPMWASLAYGAFINYGFAQTLWAGLARHLPPSTSAMSIMAIPLIGALSATVIVGEWPHWQDYVAIVFVMLAIAAVLLPPRSRKIPA
ncbi:MAG: EamA family transporter [Hylemonella sp.]